jgi:DNA-binding CsgD family transcriptional regulator
MHAKLRAHIRRYNVEHMLTTVWIDPVLNVWTAVSFYRGADGKPFTERERRLKQELMPHLIQAWNANEILYVERPLSYAQNLHNSCAIVDRDGIIYNADHGFADLLRAEHPGWLGPHLPPAMVSSVVRADGENYRGEAVVAVRLREIEYGMYLVGLRPLARVDRLSSKELAVAREFAAGRTYKEIAHSFGVSPATLHNQLHAVYAKLGVGSKIGLARQLANPE